jgi:hypothetical protein
MLSVMMLIVNMLNVLTARFILVSVIKLCLITLSVILLGVMEPNSQ